MRTNFVRTRSQPPIDFCSFLSESDFFEFPAPPFWGPDFQTTATGNPGGFFTLGRIVTPTPKDEVLAEIRGFRQQMAGEHHENVARLDKMDARMQRLEAGFVGGDPDGHRRYHELVIEEMEDRKRLRRELMTHIAKAATLSALAGVFLFFVARSKDWLVMFLKGLT